MLNTSWNSGYKSLARKTEQRKCFISEEPISHLIVDFRSCLFRYIRLVCTNRPLDEQIKCVFGLLKGYDNEVKKVFDAALELTKKEVSIIGAKTCTYVFPSSVPCTHKCRLKDIQHLTAVLRTDSLDRCLEKFKKNMFDVDTLALCHKAFESYLIANVEKICLLYNGCKDLPGYVKPDCEDNHESDRMCARLELAMAGSAVLSEDFDCVALFGATIMIKEVHVHHFLYVSKKDIMRTFKSNSRKDLVHKCCIMGTDYNLGIKGKGPVSTLKLSQKEARQHFEFCMNQQNMNTDDIYKFFCIN